VERVDGLRQQRQAREQRDLLAGQALRLAAAVPVLVERLDGVGDVVGKAQPAGDLRTARAALLGQLAVA